MTSTLSRSPRPGVSAASSVALFLCVACGSITPEKEAGGPGSPAAGSPAAGTGAPGGGAADNGGKGGKGGGPGSTGTPGVPVDPVLASFSPTRDATGVALGAALEFKFNVAPVEQDFTKVVRLQDGPGSYVPLACVPDAAAKALTCKPNAPLSAGVLYTATLAVELKFPFARSLERGESWSFRATKSDDKIPPTLAYASTQAGPMAGNGAIVLLFSEEVKWAASGKASLVGGGTAPALSAKAYGNALEITAAASIPNGNWTLKVESGIVDDSGNPFAGVLERPVVVQAGGAPAPLAFLEAQTMGLGPTALASGPWKLVFDSALLPSAAVAAVKVVEGTAGAAAPLKFHFAENGVDVKPASTLGYSKAHTLKLEPALAAWDKGTLGGSGATVPFTTQSELAVAGAVPSDGAANVDLSAEWKATFDRALLAGLPVADLVDVRDQFGKPVKVSVTGGSGSVTVKPLTAWSLSKEYSVTLLRGFRGGDQSGFAGNKTFGFKAKVDPVWESDVKPVFAARCQSCHPEYSDRDTSLAWAQRIRDAVQSGRMPQGGPLSAGQKAGVVNWFDQQLAK